MSLKMTISIGKRQLGELVLGNYSSEHAPPDLFQYVYAFTPRDKRKKKYVGEILHDYNEGPLALIYYILGDMLRRRPSLRKGPGERNRAKCEDCGDVMESIFVHDYRVCSCGKTSIDGGTSYKHNGGYPVKAPQDTQIEKMMRRLERNGEVTVKRVNGKFILYCRAGKNDLSDEQKKAIYLTGPSLYDLLVEARKRDQRGE